VSPHPTFSGGAVRWQGTVGFDSSIQISFTVTAAEGYEGVISNTAIIDHEMIAHPVTVTSESMVTDFPYLVIKKTSYPEARSNKPLPPLSVENRGNLRLITGPVVDFLPDNTNFRC
jgi:hypothetical protein